MEVEVGGVGWGGVGLELFCLMEGGGLVLGEVRGGGREREREKKERKNKLSSTSIRRSSFPTILPHRCFLPPFPLSPLTRSRSKLIPPSTSPSHSSSSSIITSSLLLLRSRSQKSIISKRTTLWWRRSVVRVWRGSVVVRLLLRVARATWGSRGVRGESIVT